MWATGITARGAGLAATEVVISIRSDLDSLYTAFLFSGGGRAAAMRFDPGAGHGTVSAIASWISGASLFSPKRCTLLRESRPHASPTCQKIETQKAGSGISRAGSDLTPPARQHAADAQVDVLVAPNLPEFEVRSPRPPGRNLAADVSAHHLAAAGDPRKQA